MATQILTQAKATLTADAPRVQAISGPQPATKQPCAAVIEQHADAPLWGHLGLRLAGDEFTRWYPVGQEQAGSLIAQLRGGSLWIATTTLNNRALLIQPAALQWLVILDDDADEPEDDWGASGEPAAGVTHLRYRDGATAALRLDAGASWGAFNAVEVGEGEGLPALLHLACWGEGMYFYAPRDRVALVDMPLRLMRDAEADELAELMASRKAD